MQNIVQGEIVIIESPFKGRTPEEEAENIEYARKAMRDSLYRGEPPFASHLLYPQMLDDADEDERRMGIEACRTNLPTYATSHKEFASLFLSGFYHSYSNL